MMNVSSHPLNAGYDELQRIVAQIKARGPSQALPRPAPEVLAAIVAHLRNDEPLTAEELREREREWRAVEDELRAVERNDMHKERWI